MENFSCMKCGAEFASESSRNIHQRHCRAEAPIPGLASFETSDPEGDTFNDTGSVQCANCGGMLSFGDYKCSICGSYVDSRGAVTHAAMPMGMQILMWTSLISGYAQLVQTPDQFKSRQPADQQRHPF